VQDDPFLQSKDSHWTFYACFGWLTFFCSPTAMAWIGRIIAWSLLAWSWQRLSFALLPVRWAAIPTALALAYYIESFHMAGEWLIGGIEGKSLAYPFLFFALEAMLRHRWNRTGVFLGIACAFHVLVGGWATLIVGVIFFISGDWQRVKFPFIGLIVGGLAALCGLVPALMLDVGASTEVVRKAHWIYTQRLPHHLVPYEFKSTFLLRFALLTVIWILLCRHRGKRQQMFNAFIWGTLCLAAIGMILAYSISDKNTAASVLRFYWFRLSDIVVPMGVAIGAMRWCVLHSPLRIFSSDIFSHTGAQRYGRNGTGIKLFPRILTISVIIAAVYFSVNYIFFVGIIFKGEMYFKFTPPDQTVPWAITLLICLGVCKTVGGRRRAAADASETSIAPASCLLLIYFAIAFYAPLTALPYYADLRTHSGQSRTETVGPNGKRAGKEWLATCQWIKENTDPKAKFWIPRDGHTFKWYAQRVDIGTWKNIPQDAESIVTWWQSMDNLFKYKDAEGKGGTDRLLTTLINSKTDEDIAIMQQKYGFEYILCAQSYEMPTHATLEKVYENDIYCLYRVVSVK
jgi:hypothetical protein